MAGDCLKHTWANIYFYMYTYVQFTYSIRTRGLKVAGSYSPGFGKPAQCLNFLLRQMQKLLAVVMKFIRSLYRLPPFWIHSTPLPICPFLAKFVDVDYHFQVQTFHFQFVSRGRKKYGLPALSKTLLGCGSAPVSMPGHKVSWALLLRLGAICGLFYVSCCCCCVVVDCGII